MLQDPLLLDNLTSPSIDLLRLLSNDERDFIRLVVETIQELRECIDEAETVEPVSCFTPSDGLRG